ncbi:SDR family NAD(P)-dependent oxidoreductase [Liberiplasma polymorphum]|uniref:SDR family NAD(P)-dependent oxidoreductase n=1 Tax=Liberiplasma polymorphum TaxID=3374570 RepID=UPI003770A6B0
MMKKKAVVTGGANGIGEAIVKKLLSNKFHVIVIDIDDQKLMDLKARYSELEIYVFDLKNVYKLEELAGKIIQKHNQIDVLINNAAIQDESALEEVTVNQFEQVLAVNLISPFFLVKCFMNHFNSDGRILNITSVHGILPRLNKYSYDASKAALNLMTKELALTLADKNIKVNALAIGATKTPMNNMFKNKLHYETSVNKIPLNRVTTAREIAKIVYKMLSKDFDYMSGTILTYDGGRSLIK